MPHCIQPALYSTIKPNSKIPFINPVDLLGFIALIGFQAA
jgi:hypothetical protein